MRNQGRPEAWRYIMCLLITYSPKYDVSDIWYYIVLTSSSARRSSSPATPGATYISTLDPRALWFVPKSHLFPRTQYYPPKLPLFIPLSGRSGCTRPGSQWQQCNPTGCRIRSLSKSLALAEWEPAKSITFSERRSRSI